MDSEEEMREAYRVVGEVEESPLFNQEDINYKNNLRWLLSLLAVVLLIPIIWIDQRFFHQTTNAFTRLAMVREKRNGI